MYKLVDQFWTFQGEGFHAGRRALFVRLPFCNLKCSWCDTEFNTFKDVSKEELRHLALSEPARFAVITGGEPMMNKQTPFIVEDLKSVGFELACETNGNFKIVDGIDFVTVSPKRDANYDCHPNALEVCSELKLVVDAGFDFTVAEKFELELARINPRARLSLSPEYNNMHESFLRMEQFIKEHPKWRVSLQTHKWLNIK